MVLNNQKLKTGKYQKLLQRKPLKKNKDTDYNKNLKMIEIKQLY
jgi:hypothetical protein